MKDEIQKYLDECIRKRKNPEPPTIDEINGYLAGYMEKLNNLPREEFEGYSSHEMAFILDRTFDKGSPLEIKKMDIADCRQIPLFRQVGYLLDTIVAEKGIKLPPNGNLPRKVVLDMYELGAPDEYVEMGIAKIRKEDDSISVELARNISNVIGAIKVRTNRLFLTKKGEKYLSKMPELANDLIRAVCCQYHAGFFDIMRAELTGHLGVGFTLIMLNKYGSGRNLESLYSDKYFKAFPALLDEREGSHCYCLRMFERRLYHLGIITRKKEKVKKAEGQAFAPWPRTYIEKTPLFDKMIRCRPPKFVLKPGRA